MINHCRHLGKRNLKSISREETVDKEIGESETAHNKMFAQWCGDVLLKVLSSFNVWCRGQDAASKPHHCANTNVGGKAFKKRLVTFNGTRLFRLSNKLWDCYPNISFFEVDTKEIHKNGRLVKKINYLDWDNNFNTLNLRWTNCSICILC